MIKGFFAGAASVLILALVGGYFFVFFRLMPANADSKPGRLERWAARKSLNATIDREAPAGPGPVAVTDANLLEGVKLYAANCAVCHGGADGKASNVAKGLYQHAPQLGRQGVEDDSEGETYWKVDHGIRLTGMPAFAATLSQEEIWKVTLFLKHMDSLPPSVDKAWKAIPSQGR